jgi:hypothetical protein
MDRANCVRGRSVTRNKIRCKITVERFGRMPHFTSDYGMGTLGGDWGARGFLVKLGSEGGKWPPVKPNSKKVCLSVCSNHQSLGSEWLAPSVCLSF